MTRCPHITQARVCCDPSRPDDSGITWCSDRWDCRHKTDARVLHLQNLETYAKRGDREGWRIYLAQVASAEGTPSADVLRQAFKQSRETK